MSPVSLDIDAENSNRTAEKNIGWRVLPETLLPAEAWVENEDTNSTGEKKQLLPSEEKKPQCRLQSGPTLGVHGHSNVKCHKVTKQGKKKSALQKRREKILAMLKPPYFMLSIIIFMVGIHFSVSERLRNQLEWPSEKWWREPWRLITYGFVHADSEHLTQNAVVAFAVGWQLEREQGWWRVLCIWCGGVVAGALGAGALQPGVKVVGASAAVYAILTAHISNICLRFGHVPLWWFRPFSVIVLSASESWWYRSADKHDQIHIAWAAHVLGAAVGIPLAFLVFTGENNGKRYIIVARLASSLLLVVGVILAAVFNSSMFHDPDEK